MSDVGWTETKFQFQLSLETRLEGPSSSANTALRHRRVNYQGLASIRRGRRASGDSDGHEARAHGGTESERNSRWTDLIVRDPADFPLIS